MTNRHLTLIERVLWTAIIRLSTTNVPAVKSQLSLASLRQSARSQWLQSSTTSPKRFLQYFRRKFDALQDVRAVSLVGRNSVVLSPEVVEVLEERRAGRLSIEETLQALPSLSGLHAAESKRVKVKGVTSTTPVRSVAGGSATRRGGGNRRRVTVSPRTPTKSRKSVVYYRPLPPSGGTTLGMRTPTTTTTAESVSKTPSRRGSPAIARARKSVERGSKVGENRPKEPKVTSVDVKGKRKVQYDVDQGRRVKVPRLKLTEEESVSDHDSDLVCY